MASEVMELTPRECLHSCRTVHPAEGVNLRSRTEYRAVTCTLTILSSPCRTCQGFSARQSPTSGCRWSTGGSKGIAQPHMHTQQSPADSVVYSDSVRPIELDNLYGLLLRSALMEQRTWGKESDFGRSVACNFLITSISNLLHYGKIMFGQAKFVGRLRREISEDPWTWDWSQTTDLTHYRL